MDRLGVVRGAKRVPWRLGARRGWEPRIFQMRRLTSWPPKWRFPRSL